MAQLPQFTEVLNAVTLAAVIEPPIQPIGDEEHLGLNEMPFDDKLEIFNWLNSDDRLKPDALFKCAEAYNEYPSASGWVGACRRIDENGTVVEIIFPNGLDIDNIGENWNGKQFYQPSCFLSTAVVREMGGLNPDLYIALDLDLWVQVDSSTAFCFGGDSNFQAPLGNVSLVTWTDGRNALSDGSANVPQMDVYFDRVSLCPTITVSPAALPNGRVTVAYSQTVTAAGGTGPYTFSLAGTLPDGLGLDAGTGAVKGTPTATGITPFAIVAADAFGCAGSRDYRLVVDPAASCPAIAIAPTTLPNTTQGAP